MSHGPATLEPAGQSFGGHAILTVISPAKRLDWSERAVDPTTPAFPDEANRLAGHARALSLGDLKALMGLSDDLARLNRDRFRAFADDPEASAVRPAALAFAGDTYQGLDAPGMDPATLDFAQARLRILSGLYGLLRPLDAIQPYRLEMGSRLKTRRGRTLYDYWGDRIAVELNRQAEQLDTDTLLNCASQEYFRAVEPAALNLRVVTPQFLDDGPKGPRIVSFHAKRARGAMARFVAENRITDSGGILDFDRDGYRFAPEHSSPDRPAFLRTARNARKAA